MAVSALAPLERGPDLTVQEVVYYDSSGNRVQTGEPRPLFVSIKDAQALTGLSRDTLWQMRKRDDNPLKAITIGRRVLIPLTALEALTSSPGFERTQARSQQRIGWPARRAHD